MPPINRKYRKSYRHVPTWFLYATCAFVIVMVFLAVAAEGVY